MSEKINIAEIFGENVFDDKLQCSERLPKSSLQAVTERQLMRA